MFDLRKCRLQPFQYAWLALAFAALGAPPAFSQDANGPDRQEIPLSVSEVPADQWGKNRLVAELAGGGGLKLSDPEAGAFNDASFWQISFNEPLPYGRKIFSFKVEVDPAHQALWNGALLQPIINGKEGAPAPEDSGNLSFEKIIGGDGKGFIPAESGTYAFELPKAERNLGIFGFMTAGADKFNITLSAFKVTVWPEEDKRVLTQRPRMSALGYLPEGRKTLLIDWWDDEDSLAAKSATITVEGPGSERQFEASIPDTASVVSESRVSEVDLSALSEPGRYVVTVPSLGPRTKPGRTAFEIVTGIDHIETARDQAWGAFYWITDDENGPFPGAHPQDIAAKAYGDEATTRDVSGGWFDAGDYGKYSVNGAYSVGLMLISGLVAPDALNHPIEPLAGGDAARADWLDVAETQLRWLIKMQGPDGGVNHKATTRDWPALNVAPMDDKAVKWLMPVSSTATADFAAVMALAARIFGDLPGDENAKLANSYEAAAQKARGWLEKHPDLVMIEKRYEGAEYGGPYDDTDDADERFFADAAYAVLTKDPTALGKAEERLAARAEALAAAKDFTEWGHVDLLAFWTLKSAEDMLTADARAIVDKALSGAAERWLDVKKGAPWQIGKRDADGFEWGSNSVVATTGWHWLLWAHATGERAYADEALDQLHYFFGRNPLGQVYVTGTGEKAAKHPHFRPVVSGAIELPPGFLVGGPNSVNLAGDPTGGELVGRAPMLRYVDDKESYATNEVAINWQATWALYNSLLVAAFRLE